MFYVMTPVTNVQLFKEFLSNQLRDGLADAIQDDMSVRELEIYQSLAFQTSTAIKSLEASMLKASRENDTKEEKGE